MLLVSGGYFFVGKFKASNDLLSRNKRVIREKEDFFLPKVVALIAKEGVTANALKYLERHAGETRRVSPMKRESQVGAPLISPLIISDYG